MVSARYLMTWFSFLPQPDGVRPGECRRPSRRVFIDRIRRKIMQPWRPRLVTQLALNRELREYSALQKTDRDNDFSKSRSVVPSLLSGTLAE